MEALRAVEIDGGVDAAGMEREVMVVGVTLYDATTASPSEEGHW